MVSLPPRPQDENELRVLLLAAEFQYSVLDPARQGLEVEIRLRMRDVLEGNEVRGIAPNWTPVERDILHPGFREEFKRRVDQTVASGRYIQTLDDLVHRFQAVTSREPTPQELEELKAYGRSMLEAQATIAALNAVLESNPRSN